MTEPIRPRLVISRCLGFAACRYNAQMLHDGFVERLLPFVESIDVCPEADIGLGTPRKPLRLVGKGDAPRLVQPATGLDATDAMQDYIGRQMGSLHDVDGFILKGRSPSCGPTGVKLYLSEEPGAPGGKGAGMFAHAVFRHFPYAAVEDEGRLTNFRLRESFLMRIFALARLRALMLAPTLAGLTGFHASHKLLLMCFNQQAMRECGRVASNSASLPVQETMRRYAGSFRTALRHEPRQSNIINALYHGYGWVSEGLAAPEKRLFLETVEAYRAGRATLATLLHLLKSYVARFEHGYLGGQLFLEPYPQELFDLADSGR